MRLERTLGIKIGNESGNETGNETGTGKEPGNEAREYGNETGGSLGIRLSDGYRFPVNMMSTHLGWGQVSGILSGKQDR